MKAPEDLAELESMMISYYAETTTKRSRSDKMYRHEVSGLMQVPEGMEVHESSTPSLMVDNLRDQIRTDEPIVTYQPSGRSQSALQFKELAQMWAAGVLHEVSASALIDPIQQVVHDFLLRGAGCIKFIVDPEYMLPPGSNEDSDTGMFPWLVKAIDPLSVFPAPGSKRTPDYILECQTRTVLDMQMHYADHWHDPIVRRGGKKRKASDPVKWLEFWSGPTFKDGYMVDPGSYVVEADGIRIIDQPNPYGVLPYVYSYSGLGRSNHDGEPSHLSEGILDSVVGELEEEIRIKTAWAHQWLFSAYPRLLTTDDPRRVRRQFMVSAGSVIKYNPGEKPEWMEQQPPNEAMLRFLEVITANIQRKVSPSLTERPSGVDAGIHQALLLGQALKVISPVRRALDIMGGDLLNGMAKQMAALSIKMNVQGGTERQDRMVSGRDFKGYTFRVQFEAIDPVENDRRMLAGLALRRERADGLPLISRRTFMERYMGGVIENIDDEESQLIAEAAVAQLVASGALLQSVMQEVQANAQAAQVAAAGDQAAAQIAGGRERGVEGLAGVGAPSPQEVGANEGQNAALGAV
jgi:hypothetical protein